MSANIILCKPVYLPFIKPIAIKLSECRDEKGNIDAKIMTAEFKKVIDRFTPIFKNAKQGESDFFEEEPGN